MMAESSGNPKAVSPCGALGLLQLMPGTARELGCADPLNPDDNLRAGTEYLAKQRAEAGLLLHGQAVTEGDVNRFALAAYNAGWGYVRAALEILIQKGTPITWASFLDVLPKALVHGRHADVKQVSGYIQKILPASG